jgi:thiopurine S-methyltransferase
LTSDPLTDQQQFKANGDKTWFVPLCGKTLDIAYLLSQGFRVFGLDAVKMAIESLEQEQKLGLTFDPESSMFTGVNGRLRIWVGDLFKCPIENYGPFDYVWDRGAFIALEYPNRQNYVDVMQRALKKKDGSCKY